MRNADQEAEDTSTDSQDMGDGILDDWDDFTEVWHVDHT